MQGKGEFKHAIQGHILKGYFAKNLFVEVHQGKKYYLNPLDTKEQHQTFIKKSKESIIYEEKKAKEKDSHVRCMKVDTLQKLRQALADTKEAGRTPMIINSNESQLRSHQVYEALETDGAEIQTLHMRDLALKAENIQYEHRQLFIKALEEVDYAEMLHNMITKEQSGRILINIDENQEDDKQEGNNSQKQWNHLYDPDYKLIFNDKIFPQELLRGNKVGEFFIVQYGLFDDQIKPENINLSVSNPNESHMIQFQPDRVRRHRGSGQ